MITVTLDASRMIKAEDRESIIQLLRLECTKYHPRVICPTEVGGEPQIRFEVFKFSGIRAIS